MQKTLAFDNPVTHHELPIDAVGLLIIGAVSSVEGRSENLFVNHMPSQVS
ncbi:MAG TPA: hypothetical protein VGD63_12290 [Steroidobacteraceae bacterium]